MNSAPTIPPSQIDQLIRDPQARVHFVGVGGTGMSGYADFRVLSGALTSGSDRDFDLGRNLAARDGFQKRGVQIFAQDGSGVPNVAALVVSAAIEPTVPDYAVAVAAGIPIITRPEWLAAHYRAYDCIAITGTSGKSTVTGMIYTILKGCGIDPGLMMGAELRALLDTEHPGNAAAGSGPLVLEADESDKGIANYAPHIGVILNLQRDHDEPENMLPALMAFKNNCRKCCIISDDPALTPLRDNTIIVGASDIAHHRITDITLDRDSATFRFDGHLVTVPVPGVHNVHNAAMALATGLQAGANLPQLIAALATYRGIARRFEIVGAGNGIEVVDDYAHNPAKIAAVIANTHLRSTRTILWFQPHGFGPTRFLRPDLVAMLTDILRPQDELYIAPIYYVGGTAAQDISSADLIADLATQGRTAHLAATRDEFIAQMERIAQPGDCIAIVGGRDPSLPTFARAVARAVIRA